MEIGYTNFELDNEFFTKGEIIGLVDKNSNFIYNRIYDLRPITFNSNAKVITFLGIESIKKRKLVKELKDELAITKDIEKRQMKSLTNAELVKVLILKACLIDAQVLVFSNIDTYLNDRDLKDVFIALRRYREKIGKTIIFTTNKVDNIINNTNYYVIASENRVIYSGNDINTLKDKTSIMNFVDAANKKGAKLNYYKDANDLLKAIYRSVK